MDASLLSTKLIWHPEWIDRSSHSAGGFVDFRKTIHIISAPETDVRIEITADTKYKLYINSTLVAFGPVKGDENAWFYDVLNIKNFLKAGHNTIVVRVLRLYHGTPYGTSFPRLHIPGLFIQCEADQSGIDGLHTDDSWECAIDDAVHLPINQAEDEFLHIYESCKSSTESVNWVPATILDFPISHGLSPPWKLVPRMIPQQRLETARFQAIHNLRSKVSLEIWEHWLLSPTELLTPLALPAGSSHHLELESEEYLTAFLNAKFERPQHAGSLLTLTCSECYEDPMLSIPYIRQKGNRCDITKQLFGPVFAMDWTGLDLRADLIIHDGSSLAYNKPWISMS